MTDAPVGTSLQYGRRRVKKYGDYRWLDLVSYQFLPTAIAQELERLAVQQLQAGLRKTGHLGPAAAV